MKNDVKILLFLSKKSIHITLNKETYHILQQNGLSQK